MTAAASMTGFELALQFKPKAHGQRKPLEPRVGPAQSRSKRRGRVAAGMKTASEVMRSRVRRYGGPGAVEVDPLESVERVNTDP